MNRRQGSVPPWQSWRLVASLAMLAAGFTILTVFVAANFVVVELSFIVFRLDIRLGWVLFGAAGLGFCIGLLAVRLRRLL